MLCGLGVEVWSSQLLQGNERQGYLPYSFGPWIPIFFSKISFLQVPGTVSIYCLSLLMFTFQQILNTKKKIGICPQCH